MRVNMFANGLVQTKWRGFPTSMCPQTCIKLVNIINVRILNCRHCDLHVVELNLR